MIDTSLTRIKTVGEPCDEYLSVKPSWDRVRAITNGESSAKKHDLSDTRIGVESNKLLLPFSPSMTEAQYSFYVSEAELPGIVAQFSKMICGGLLRKDPIVELPEEFDSSYVDWIKYDIAQDGSSLVHFLDEALKEELQTSRAWVYVDYPNVSQEMLDSLSDEEISKIKPYPVLWKADNVINWRVEKNDLGEIKLSRVIIRDFVEKFKDNEFHPTLVDTVMVHEIDPDNGYYRIRVFEKIVEETTNKVVSGVRTPKIEQEKFELVDVKENILVSGKRLDMIPAWPLNGQISAGEPTLMALVDKEIALYNKISRRNHLLYSATTYTPIVSTDMSDEDFQSLVNSGLGTWLRLRPGESATVLETPTAALTDMDRAIAANIEEMAKMGVRMLTPEISQSGVALDIRNAAQNAQLGTLNTRVSNTLRQVIAFLLYWRSNFKVHYSQIKFEMSADMSPTPIGENWLRLATEWYQAGLIPRSVWLTMLKQNDMLSPDYDDTIGQQEITDNAGSAISNSSTNGDNFASQIQGN